MRVPSLADLARNFLEEAIISGKFEPGSRIREERIATELKISRPPIREAFKMLEAEGLIVREPRRGVFVAEINYQDAWEIYTLKAELYEFSITLAFDSLSGSDINRMGRLVEAMEECVNSDSPLITSYQELNDAFHDLHVDKARHQRLKQMLRALHNQVRYYSYQTLMNAAHLKTSCDYHRRIYEAIRLGDLEATLQLTREHILVALNRFVPFSSIDHLKSA